MSKVIAINGSPRAGKGNTARLLTPFLEGMKDGGCDVELLYTSKLKIKPCNCGQMICWYGTPGECCIHDDMQMLYAKLREADTAVLATPVYIPLPGPMQNLINRLCPLAEPHLQWTGGRTRARRREGVSVQRIAVVVTGGWWELENLDLVVRIAQELAENFGVAFAGAVRRPHADVMSRDGKLTADGEAVLAAAKRAGHELATEGSMRPETLEAISRPLIAEEALRQYYNSLL